MTRRHILDIYLPGILFIPNGRRADKDVTVKPRFLARLRLPPHNRPVTLLLVALAAFLGAVAMQKSVLLKRPQGDLKVFCCAGWAVRQGGQLLYTVRDDNGWHYHYPPTFAILMAPLADPPRRDLALSAASALGASTSPGGGGALQAACALAASPAATGAPPSPQIPYPVTVAIFYLLNLVCLAVAVRLTLSAVRDRRSLSWRHAVLPVLVCLPAVGMTLVRGQVQLLLLALLAGFLAGLVRGRRLAAGLCLAGAICLKIFPAYLLVVPVVRRDGRCLAGCLLGLVGGLVVLPVAAVGPEATARLYVDRAHFVTSVFRTEGSTRPGAGEMLDATRTHSQSFQVVLHKTLHLLEDETPPLPGAGVRVAHWLLAAVLTLAALARGRVREEEGLPLAQRVALLMLLMILACPVCHLHYFTLAVPLVAVLHVPRRLPGRGVAFAAFLAALGVAMLPRLDFLGDVGLPMYAALALGVLGWRAWPGEGRKATIWVPGGCVPRERELVLE